MRISDWSSDVCSSDLAERDAEIGGRHAERHLFAIEGDLLDGAEALAAIFDRPVDARIARGETLLEIGAAEREILFLAQARARGAAEARRDRSQPGARSFAIGFDVAHAAFSRRRSTRTSSQKKRLPCSTARLRARRM